MTLLFLPILLVVAVAVWFGARQLAHQRQRDGPGP